MAPERDPLLLARRALEGRPAWLVGGAVRDRLLGRQTLDLDVVVEGPVAPAAKALGRAGRAAAFPLSDTFGGWRVVARDRGWQVDVLPVNGRSIEDDLAARDFTVNAIAEPLAGGEPIDPFEGREDLAAGRLRMVSADGFAADPLRVLRAARLACELRLEPDRDTRAAAGAQAPALRRVSPERVFAELKRVVIAPEALRGLAEMDRLGVTPVVLPELDALRGIEQSAYHHLDVYEHTLAVFEQAMAIQRDPEPVFGPQAAEVAALLAQPLADELDRGAIYEYLTATQPVAADVAVLSVADRLATRGRKADEAIAKHVELARRMLVEAVRFERERPAPLVRGDELAAELGIAPGPELGRLLAELAEAQFAGEVTTRDEALRFARTLARCS